MTVNDLIEQLQKLPAELRNARVMVAHHPDGYNEVGEISPETILIRNRKPGMFNQPRFDNQAGQYLAIDHGAPGMENITDPAQQISAIILHARLPYAQR